MKTTYENQGGLFLCLMSVVKGRGTGTGSGTIIHKTNKGYVGTVENRADIDRVPRYQTYVYLFFSLNP
jgi:hypothetical protein